MAPEVLENGTASFASEVYSLGVLLFFLLSGRLPIEGKSVSDLKRAHAEGQRKRLRDLRPDVPDGVVQVIERAIVSDPAARYQTAGEFEHALTTASGSPAVVIEPTPVGLTGWTAMRSPLIWLALALAMVAGAGIAAAALTRWNKPPAPLLSRFTIGPPFNVRQLATCVAKRPIRGVRSDRRRPDRFWVRALDEVAAGR